MPALDAPRPARWDLLATSWRRRILFAVLYFAEGAPIGFLWWYLPTRLRLAGVPVDRITQLTALLVLPWTLKFVWAPLLDGSRRWGASYRGWAIVAQSAMALALAPLLVLDPAKDFATIVACLLAHSFAAATQDVAIDGLAISTTPEGQRGSLNGWMQAGMLLGRSLFGGVALMVAARLHPRAVPVGLLVAILSTLVLLVLGREPVMARAGTAGRGLARALASAIRRPTTWFGLAFALLAGAGFEAVGAVAGPFLVDRGQSGESIGFFLAFPAIVATVGGGFVGGALADRAGRARAAAITLATLVAAILALAAMPGAGPRATFGLLGAVYLGIGAFTATSYALFMDLTDPRLGATQFSSYMAATNACEAWSGFVVGLLVVRVGYAPAFALLAGASLCGLPLAWLIARARSRESAAGPGTADPAR